MPTPQIPQPLIQHARGRTVFVAPDEKLPALKDAIAHGSLTRASTATLYSWNEFTKSGHRDLGAVSRLVFLPVYLETQSWHPEITSTLQEWAPGYRTCIFLLPSINHNISNPSNYHIERFQKDVRHWRENPALANQVVTELTLTLARAMYGLRDLQRENLSLPQQVRYECRPFLEYLLRRWVKKHDYTYKLRQDGGAWAGLAVLPELEDAHFIPALMRGKGRGLVLPLDAQTLRDWEDADLLIEIAEQASNSNSFARGHFAEVDLLLDWPEVELERPEFGVAALSDMVARLRKLKDILKPLAKIDSSTVLRAHLDGLVHTLANMRNTLHVIDTWDSNAALMSRDAIRRDFDAAVAGLADAVGRITNWTNDSRQQRTVEQEHTPRDEPSDASKAQPSVAEPTVRNWSELPAPDADILDDGFVKYLPKTQGGHPLIGSCPIWRLIAKGRMGRVYHGRHSSLPVDVAIKLLPEFNNDDARLRWQNEIRAAITAESPHLVKIYACGTADVFPFIVFEYIDGPTAQQYLEEKSRPGSRGLPERDALEIAIAATRGLCAAHHKEIIHRDIAPKNILVPNRELRRSKLADLGLAKLATESQDVTRDGEAMGTPGYMPPEQFLDAKTVTFASDVFAMGATLYTLLSGSTPFAGERDEVLYKTLHEQPAPLPDTVSPPARAVAEKCLMKAPDDRYVNAIVLLAALETAQHGARDARTSLATASPARIGREPLEQLVRITDVEMYHPGFFSRGTAVYKLTVNNTSDFDISSIECRVDYRTGDAIISSCAFTIGGLPPKVAFPKREQRTGYAYLKRKAVKLGTVGPDVFVFDSSQTEIRRTADHATVAIVRVHVLTSVKLKLAE